MLEKNKLRNILAMPSLQPLTDAPSGSGRRNLLLWGGGAVAMLGLLLLTVIFQATGGTEGIAADGTRSGDKPGLSGGGTSQAAKKPAAGSSAFPSSKPGQAQRPAREPLTDAEIEARFWPLYERAKAVVDEYHTREEELFAQRPELKQLKDYKSRIMGEFYEKHRESSKLSDEFQKNNKLNEKKWGDLYTLTRPEALLSVISDPAFRTYFDDVFNYVGFKNNLAVWIPKWDRIAGYKPDGPLNLNSSQALAEELKKRVPAYAPAFDRLARSPDVPAALGQHVRDYTFASEYGETAEWYVESFYAGRLEELRRNMNNLSNELAVAIPQKGGVAPKLLGIWAKLDFPDLGKK